MSDVDDAIERAEEESEWNLSTSGIDVARQAWHDRSILAAEVKRLREENQQLATRRDRCRE